MDQAFRLSVHRERGAAATAVDGLRVGELEPRAVQTIHIVENRTVESFHARRIDEDLKALVIDDAIASLWPTGELERVLVARASAGHDGNAQAVPFLTLACKRPLDVLDRLLGEIEYVVRGILHQFSVWGLHLLQSTA